jgi:hypothetical protein
VTDKIKKKNLKACLALSRKEKIYITEEGEIRGKIETTPYNQNYPCLKVL